MNLTIREAATLLGMSARTLRSQVARGEISGTKEHGRWMVADAALPLTDKQRKALEAKADRIRSSVEKVLPSSKRRSNGEHHLADNDAFRLARPVLFELRLAARDDAALVPACTALESALLSLAEGVLHFSPPIKRDALLRARTHLSHCIAHLCLAPQAPNQAAWLQILESQVHPALGGLLRWVERQRKEPR